MDFIKVAEISELPENKMMMVKAGGTEVLLANVAGAYYAIANKCTHLGASLARGKLEGNTVRCSKHGALFDVKTGEAVGDAKIGFIKMKVANEPSYPVKIEGTDILVGIT
jgi:3-phenylpropionate/trans-cinnamate dioxygenase ferredoxin subunit